MKQRIMGIIDVVAELAEKKNIGLSYDIPDDIEVYTDKNMLKSILQNLITNAIKFTPENGSVSIFAELTADHSVIISVSDTGIGMNQSMVSNLFKIDVNTNRKGTSGEASSGLGLMICKDFIGKHGGKIWVESDEGKGSTFHFSLPMNHG